MDVRTLHISRESWPELTTRPHFVVDLDYAGCRIDWDDIYWDAQEQLPARLRALREARRGKVVLDGGFRFALTVEMRATGGVLLKFRTESGMEFPGKRVLEGFFEVDGEYTDAVLSGLLALLEKGHSFTISGSPGTIVDVP